MKQLRIFAGIIAALIVPLFGVGQAAAATQSIVQEIHVRAIVPAHRDIILDAGGDVSRIVSNTPEDVTPTVYYMNDLSANKRPLTDDIYATYRQIVPVGTAKYGVLYQRTVAQTILAHGHTAMAALTPVHKQSAIAFLLNNYHPVL